MTLCSQLCAHLKKEFPYYIQRKITDAVQSESMQSQPQCARAAAASMKEPQAEEPVSTREPASSGASELVRKVPSSDHAASRPNYSVACVGVNTLSLSVHLPGVESAAALSFELGTTEMELEGSGYYLQLAFVQPVDADTAQVKFDKSSSELQICVQLC